MPQGEPGLMIFCDRQSGRANDTGKGRSEGGLHGGDGLGGADKSAVMGVATGGTEGSAPFGNPQRWRLEGQGRGSTRSLAPLWLLGTHE
jgi:hypothetical protein